MIYTLVKNTDEILSKPTIEFDFANPPIDPKEFFENLKETQIANNGLGLSANQVGFPWSVFTMGNPGDPNSISGIFNPMIVDHNDKQILLEEGCLSYPGLIVKIKRYDRIRLRFTSWNGERDTRELSGMTARIVQHEMCHMNGERFFATANRYHLEKARKKIK